MWEICDDVLNAVRERVAKMKFAHFLKMIDGEHRDDIIHVS